MIYPLYTLAYNCWILDWQKHFTNKFELFKLYIQNYHLDFNRDVMFGLRIQCTFIPMIRRSLGGWWTTILRCPVSFFPWKNKYPFFSLEKYEHLAASLPNPHSARIMTMEAVGNGLKTRFLHPSNAWALVVGALVGLPLILYLFKINKIDLNPPFGLIKWCICCIEGSILLPFGWRVDTKILDFGFTFCLHRKLLCSQCLRFLCDSAQRHWTPVAE